MNSYKFFKLKGIMNRFVQSSHFEFIPGNEVQGTIYPCDIVYKYKLLEQ